MIRLRLCVLALAAMLGIAAQPVVAASQPQAILVGDSTMATETGYGDALCCLLKPDVSCINRAKGGRSSASYRAEGSWDAILDLLHRSATERQTYVLIQFGHNDQPGKPGRSTDLATDYPANLARYVREVRAAHAVPILITPLTRRDFRDGQLQNTLAPWADAMRSVANTEHVTLLDLNTESASAAQAMGEAAADGFAMAPPAPQAQEPAQKGEHYRGFDKTHLGTKGADYFARMVAHEWQQAMPEIYEDFKSNAMP
jgi:lysophospholipase L1-like esterase